jgi:HEAT repeat protein
MRAARLLASHGEQAVDPLLGLLEDHSIDVRVLAAESLGQVGDDRAIQPLMNALRSSFWGGSAWSNLLLGLVLAVVAAALTAVLLYGVVVAKIGFLIMTTQVWRFPFWVIGRRRKRSQLVGAVTQALVRIAGRSPSPELGGVVKDLRVVAADRVQQVQETRDLTRKAADEIEALVAEVRTLPVAAAAPPSEGAAVLPRPAQSPEPEAQVLPRVSG